MRFRTLDKMAEIEIQQLVKGILLQIVSNVVTHWMLMIDLMI